MEEYKILNLYACLGGNRYKWNEVYDNIEVTAVELDSELAKLYQERFPNDKVIIADAHQYLLDHYKGFDFIWTSPPCPTHSRLVTSNKNKIKMKYPDMKLYQEIIFLDNFFEGKYVVENVIPYYTPLIPAKKRGRHLYWTNFNLPNDLKERKTIGISTAKDEVNKLCKFHDYDFRKYKGKQPLNKIARNLVDYEAGKTILQTALNIKKQNELKQLELL
ncbi:class I SAM-dependent methyltransferase [Joostella sp. CR20]|uniref:class I SAM-dependent methyltransferase n=1 Tax=Joostella sp. CR20 TaxID=2804312 RepID=UPI00313B1AB6